MRRIFMLAAIAAASCASSPQEASDADARIQYYSGRIEAHPGVYALHLGLAQAYLDKARETHDPSFIHAALAESDASLSLLESVEGFKMKARIAAFRHHFDEALEWAAKAEALTTADVDDGAIAALKVEALLGLGRADEARALLPARAEDADGFHVAAALGHVYAAIGSPDLAAAAFARAAAFAEAEGADQLAGWAETSAAGAYLDAGDAALANPHLERAKGFDADSRFFRTHLAERAALEGRPAEALAVYERLIAEADDPELRRRAFLLARLQGDATRAAAHLVAAERLLRAALDAGESYARADLARLRADADGADVAPRSER
ncbi:MAG TPA: hypothetical protein PKH09_00060 [Parvularculaceae bacterium]|nr:hypothetical protein [Parvularculaceae bacterium]